MPDGVPAGEPAPILAVHVAVLDGMRVFLLERGGTGFGDGTWCLPTGHVEVRETPAAAAVREAREEAGVSVNAADLELFGVSFREAAAPRLDLFFRVRRWQGEARLAEPSRARRADWHDARNLPTPLFQVAAPFADELLREGPVVAYHEGR